MSEFVNIFLTAAIAIMVVLIFACFLRALIGPTIADKILSVNMIGTLVIMIIACLCVQLEEGWLADVAVVYAMISFLAVVVLAKIYIGVYKQRKSGKENGNV